MSELDPRLERWIAPLRRTREPDPGAVARLRTALRREQVGSGPRRRIVLTPVGALAAALSVAAVTSLGWLAAGRMGRVPADDGSVPVQFVLHAPDARTVTLVGDFNDWDPEALPMTQTGSGVWSVVVPLRPGTIHYSFLVDGQEWRADPNAATAPGDFGRPSSIALVDPVGAQT